MFDGFGIPGNRKVFEDLVALLRSEKAIAFVGAGASAPLYPLWTELIGKLADLAVVQEQQRDFWRRQAAGQPDQIARQIRGRLDAGEYAKFMRREFGPKDGSFTEAHAHLARLPFQGFVTTNYDPGLATALLELEPSRRPQTFTWKDDQVSLWRREEAADPRELPILHAHGRYNDVDSLVLGIDDYRRVYGTAHPYLDLLKHLWTREQLVFLGFSFADRWLTTFADLAVTQAGTRGLEAPRHIAVLSIPEAERDDAPFHAEGLRESLRARVLFYPVENDDHSKLGVLLGELLASVLSAETDEPDKLSTTTAPADALDAWFEHVEASSDRFQDHFGALGRPESLASIDKAWVEIQLQPDLERQVAHEYEGKHSKDSLVGQQLTLDEALSIDRAHAPWVTGCWLLEGPPGSGKTTMLRHFARTLAKGGRDVRRIPLFVSLPRLLDPSQNLTLLQLATAGVRLVVGGEIERRLEAAGRAGHLVVLLDGLDEVLSERRALVNDLLAKLRRDWPDCPLVVSTRPLGRGEMPAGFPRLELLPLHPTRQHEFLVKWFTHADKEDPTTEAKDALDCFTGHRGVGKLAGNPLYLTLLALLWLENKRPPERLGLLYDEVFDLLLSGRHKPEPGPIQAQNRVREALAQLAYGMTFDDHWAEPVEALEDRLRSPQLEGVRRGLETVARWRDRLDRFFLDVYERTQVLGPHDGQDGDWRFWHRTFREALTAERLGELYESEGRSVLDQISNTSAPGVEGLDEGRWAEPLALYAGRLERPDNLLEDMAEANSGLALRAMVFTQGLETETLIKTLGLTERLDERAQVFEAVPTQLDDAEACLELVERLKESLLSGFDYFWLDWILGRVAQHWPGFTAACRAARQRLFEHLPPPDPKLFVAPTNLWCTVPVGEGWIGSPVDEEGRYSDEGPRHRMLVEKAFRLASTPVTVEQFAAFSPRHRPYIKDCRPDHPVPRVTWYEAVIFCRWLAQVPELAGARLPTEEEWEYACRAGTETRYSSGNLEADMAEVGWYDGNSEGLQPVGRKQANRWGLYDMHGNVWEWTASAWKRDYSAQADGLVIDPAEEPADLAAPPRADRVFRGGSCSVTADWARSAYRSGRDPRFGYHDQGFRVLLPSPSGRRS